MGRWTTRGLAGAVVALAALTTSAPAGAADLAALREALRRPQLALPVALPDGRTVRFATTTEELGEGAVGTRGRSAGGATLLAFTGGDGSVRATVHADGGRFRLGEHAGVTAWRPVAPEGPLPPEPEPEPARARSAVPAPQAPPGADGVFEIDVLVLYTQRYPVAFASEEAARALLQQSMFNANAYFANSAIPVRYRTVGLERFETAQTFAGPGAEKDPAVVARRNAVGADLVVLIDGGERCGGQAKLFNGSRRTADGAPPEHVDPERDAFAYGVLLPPAACRFTDFLVAHELGHTLGGGHDIHNSGTLVVPYQQVTPALGVGGGYWKEFAHGVRCGDAGANGAFKYVDIMAYGLHQPARGTDVRGDFFSSPAIVRGGERCGSEGTPGVEPTRADNARSITLAAPYVAAYREPVLPSDP